MLLYPFNLRGSSFWLFVAVEEGVKLSVSVCVCILVGDVDRFLVLKRIISSFIRWECML